jgi:hypothetical protein
MSSTTFLCSEDIANNKNLSHEQRNSSLQGAINSIVDKVKNRQPFSYLSVERQLELIDLIADFRLGNFYWNEAG